jgi:hypothetical protein
MKLIIPLLSRIARASSSKEAICCTLISSATSYWVSRSRYRFRAIRSPSSASTIGSPSRSRRARRELKPRYDVATWRTAIVEIAMIAPVTE